MKKYITSAAGLAAIALFASSAFGQPPSSHTPPPSPNQSSGNTWTVGGGANFAGGFEIGGSGDNLQLDGMKEGGSESVLNMNVAGDLCGLDCQDGSFDFSANAFERVYTAGTVSSASGGPISMFNSGGSQVIAGFTFSKMPTTSSSD